METRNEKHSYIIDEKLVPINQGNYLNGNGYRGLLRIRAARQDQTKQLRRVMTKAIE